MPLCSTILLENMTVIQVVNKFVAFCGRRKVHYCVQNIERNECSRYQTLFKFQFDIIQVVCFVLSRLFPDILYVVVTDRMRATYSGNHTCFTLVNNIWPIVENRNEYRNYFV